MAMSVIWVGMILFSFIWSAFSGTLDLLGTSALEGAASAVELCLGIAGTTCLWCGITEIMDRAGFSKKLSKLLSPLLGRLFPSCRKSPELLDAVSGNVTANFLGLGNAATPLGIRAASLMSRGNRVTDEMCLFIVINTASIQLIPATVAAIRAGAGSEAPFEILPAVWLTSLVSVMTGIAAAAVFRRIWKK